MIICPETRASGARAAYEGQVRRYCISASSKGVAKVTVIVVEVHYHYSPMATGMSDTSGFRHQNVSYIFSAHALATGESSSAFSPPQLKLLFGERKLNFGK